jgi:hypothetical protein
MGSKVGGGGPKTAPTPSMGSIQGYGGDFTSPLQVRNKKKTEAENTATENLGTISSVSTIRKNRGLLSNSMSDTLG